MKIKMLVTTINLGWLLISQLFPFSCSEAQSSFRDLISRVTGYVVYVRSQECKDYFNFVGSKLKPIVKVTISYSYVTQGVPGQESVYETLWYRGCDPIGCRKYRDWDIGSKEFLYVSVNTCSEKEIGAATNSLVRILLDATINRNRITAIEVTSISYVPIINQLQNENFFLPKNLQISPPIPINLTLVDEIGDKQTLVYAGN